MKRVFLLLCIFLSFILSGCFFINDPEKNTEGSTEPSEEIATVKILNNSQFDIDLYSEPERDITSFLGTVKKNDSLIISDKESVSGAVYYVVYHIDIGIDLPWYNNDSSVLFSKIIYASKVSILVGFAIFSSIVLLFTGDANI